MVLINKDNFLKEYFGEQKRAKQIIDVLMGQTGFTNINFLISTEIIIIDGLPKVKVTIKQYPEIYIISNKNLDVTEMDYKTIELSKYLNEQSDYD